MTLLSAAACTWVMLLKLAWSGEQDRIHQKCRKLWLQAGHPRMNGRAFPVCKGWMTEYQGTEGTQSLPVSRSGDLVRVLLQLFACL